MSLKSKIENTDGTIRVLFDGQLGEHSAAQLDSLLKTLPMGPCIFNFKGVSGVNSLGAANWIKFMKSASIGRSLVFEHCPPAIVGQINVVPSFLGDSVVQSVYAPYACAKCDFEDQFLLERGVNMPTSGEKAPKRVCPKCGAKLEMEEFEMKFFRFTWR